MQGTSDPTRVELLDAAAHCRHLVPVGSVHAFLADHRHDLFPEALFADLFGSPRGRPSVPADVVATVMVLQALEGLSDRDATRQLACNIAWKVACGLALTDPGFHASVLTLWRARLRASARPERIFEAVRQVIAKTGVLGGRTRRALDSTLLDDAVATQDTVTQLVAAIRRARRLLPAAAALQLAAHDYNRTGKPACAWDDQAARQQLVSALVNDALAVLDAVQDTELDVEQAEAVGLLGVVAGQDVEPGEQPGSFRIARKVAPDRVISVVDPDARHMHKSVSSYRDGYKAHLAVEPETGLVTAAALTPANAADGSAGVQLLVDEPQGLEVLADSAYGGGPTRSALRAAGHQQTIKPLPLRAAVPGVHQGRLHHRPGCTNRDLPGRAHRPDQPGRAGILQTALRHLPAAQQVHHRQGQGWAHGAGLPVGGRAASRPPPRHRPRVPGQLSALAADGGTLPGVAGRRWQPAGPLPRRHPQPALAVAAGRGDQPAPPGQPRPHPRLHRNRVGARRARVRAARGVK